MSVVVTSASSSDDDEIDRYFCVNNKQNNDEDEKNRDENIVIGIDLGTTNSCVSVWRNNNLEIIPDMHGNRTIPSIVSFTNRTKYVGREAKKQIEINTDNTFYEVKRLIGRKYDDETVLNDKSFLTYQIDKDEQDNVVVVAKTNNKNIYTPEEISSMVLIELKRMAEEYLRQPVSKAVITVPAYFNDAQRQATKDAATIAGLDCIRIINEPTAAALSYGLEKKSLTNNDLYVIVYDLGGGTLDVSLLNISEGMFQVLGSSGNTHLGGADFDNRIMSHCLKEFKKKHKYDNLDDLNCMSAQKLKQACENAKKRLSETPKTTIAVKDFYDGKNLLMTLTRETFYNMCKDLFILCLKSVDDVLKNTGIDKKSINEILLVGGGTRMPQIRENLKLYFNKEPNTSINPDEVVSAGAAIQGYILTHENDPFSENVVLLDIISLSLGVEIIGGVMNVLIPRNSVIPIKRKRKYTTDSDFETSVNIKIYEGERKMTKDNFLVGEFELTNIESAPRGVAQIEITFSVDVNGIISVSAVDLKNQNNIYTINVNSNKGRLSSEKIKELVIEAKNAEAKDKLEREKMQFFYEIEDLASNVKLNAENDEFKLKEADKTLILNDIQKIMDWLKEKKYNEREKKEYLQILSRLKGKYGTLILKASHDDNNVKSSNVSNVESTTVYGDEDDEETLYEAIEDDELGIRNIADEEVKKEIKRVREELVTLCYSIFDIISSGSLQIDSDHTNELKDYVDDILLWAHVKEKISLAEYRQKLDEVNNVCNVIVEKYNDVQIFTENNKEIKTKRVELEQLCYTILSSIVSNVLGLHDEDVVVLKQKVEECLDWLIDIDIEVKKAELENKVYEISENMYDSKIIEINELCDKLYENIVDVNFNNDNNNIDDILNSFNVEDTNGMTIESLRNK